jgi:hypothetical protein
VPQERLEQAIAQLAAELRDRLRYWNRIGDRGPVLDALGQSTYEGVAFLRGMLEGRGFGIVGDSPAG